MDDDDLLDDRAGLGGLKFVERLKVERNIPTDRYSFEKQETEARVDKDLYYGAEVSKFGCIVEIDPAALTIDIKKTRKTADVHPKAAYVWDSPINPDKIADSLLRTGDWVLASSIDAPGRLRAVRDLLCANRRVSSTAKRWNPLPGEGPKATACRIVSALDRSVFAIQGPPGAGKTFTGARMICQLVKQGKKVGVTALSHKVIRKLLEEVLMLRVEDEVPKFAACKNSAKATTLKRFRKSQSFATTTRRSPRSTRNRERCGSYLVDVAARRILRVGRCALHR